MNIALLERLRDAAGVYLPLDALGASPDQTRRDLDELQAFGFAIERHPIFGVTYRGPAERLCPDQIEHQLGTVLIGRRVAVWNRVTSTNDVAARATRSSANEGLVVLAEEQSAGRGRRGRSWTAPPCSSILMSVLLFPPDDFCESSWLTALGAVAVAEVVASWTGADARIKWPNDVRVGGKKVAGILVERGAGAVIGIGVNANVAESELPDELWAKATSLLTLRGERVDRSELSRDLIRRLDAWYEKSRRDGPSALAAAWRLLSEHLGRSVRVETGSGTFIGRLDELDLRSGLCLTSAGGVCHRIPGCEVVAIAPDDRLSCPA
jgi:BirA family biotin operon repressor/biotin-[acetyl-CoA-carboxylase] ligase